jgi:3-hydroxyanthranilate 3,4-dioxygenase
MLLKIVENDDFRDIVIHEGESFLLPGTIVATSSFPFFISCSTNSGAFYLPSVSIGNTPHSPRRSKDTIGLVMERARPPQMIDRIRWYCDNKTAHGTVPTIIREESFYCADIEIQLKEVIDNWMEDENSRRCGSCGEISSSH